MTKLRCAIASFTTVLGCAGAHANAADQVALANKLMKAGLASDISVRIDVGTERYFPVHETAANGSGDVFDYVCGRGIFEQPGGMFNGSMHFIIPIRNGSERGLTDFDDGQDPVSKKRFDAKWARRCPGYALLPW